MAAVQGNAPAQSNLGLMYYKGLGVTQDHQEAVMWYRQGATQGNALAQSNLGMMYYKGESVAQDYVRAHMWLNLAAAKGASLAPENRDKLVQSMTPGKSLKRRNWQEFANDAITKDAISKVAPPVIDAAVS